LIFSVLSIPSWADAFPFAHYGNLLVAFVMSYAVIRHQLVDIKLVLRQGMAWVTLGIIGILSFWIMLIVAYRIFDIELNVISSIIVTVIALIAAIFVYKIRNYFFEIMSRAFQGSAYNYRRQLTEFTNKIHNVFSLKEQGGELLALIIKAINIKRACMLFPEIGGEDFETHFVESVDKENRLSTLKLR
jgi:hypothetical protein